MNVGSLSTEGKQQMGLYGIAISVAVIVLLGGYFIFVKSATEQATFLQTRIQILNNQAQSAQTTYAAATQLSKVQLADLFDLTRAMPDDPQVADVLVVLGRLAQNSSVQFDSIKPSKVVPLAGYQAVPMEVIVEGNFYDLMEFMYELRHLVDVRQDVQGAAKLYATGRLFIVNDLSIDILPVGDLNKPRLTATIDLDAFVYGAAAPPPGAPAATTGTGTTGTTTTSASAAGAPAGGSH